MESMEIQAQSQNFPQNLIAFKGEIYKGSLPKPEILERYKSADPSFPERIMKMAEKHNEADVKIKNGFVFSNTIIPMIGQFFTFFLGIFSLLACIFLAYKGYTSGAIAAVTAGFTPIIINAFKNLKTK